MTDGLAAEFTVSRDSGFRLSLDLQIEAGKTVALLGPNGAGKSTAVGVIAGLIPIDSGTISLAGQVLLFHPSADALESCSRTTFFFLTCQCSTMLLSDWRPPV